MQIPFFFLPKFDLLNLLKREAIVISEYSLQDLSDRPWVEFELLENDLEVRDANERADNIEAGMAGMEAFKDQ